MWDRIKVTAALWACAAAAAAIAVAPAVATADDTASVDSTGVITVTGDSSANTIHIGNGGDSSGTSLPYQGSYGAEIWESGDGQTITAGAGCTASTKSWEYSGTVLFCGTSSDHTVVVNGNDGDDTFDLEDGQATGSADRPIVHLTVNGGEGNDTFNLTIPANLADNAGATIAVSGGDGNDTISSDNQRYLCSKGMTTTVDGGPGNDVLYGFNCPSVIHGGDGDDQILGGDAADQIFGDAGDDTLAGGGGDDTLDGGAGRDTLSAGDSALAPGTDTFNAVDGEADRITCGFGSDTANVDQYDTVPTASSPYACAKVNLTAVGTCPSGQTGTPPNCTTPVTTCPTGETGTPPNCRGQSPTPVARVKAITVKGTAASASVSCAVAARCSVSLELTIVETVRKHGRSRRVTVSLGGAKGTVPAGATRTVAVKLNRAGLALLRAHHRIKVTLTVTQGKTQLIKRSVTFATAAKHH